MAVTQQPRTLLILSQVYVPDPASVGQHIADAAVSMARRGYRVVVLTSGRGYGDPSMRYPAREVLDGVEVRRLPFSSFGKKSILARLLGAFSFLAQCVVRGSLVRGLDCVLVSTSPPMCSAAALIIGAVRRAPIKYWVMDLNPDQMIAMGWTQPSSFGATAFDWLNRSVLRRAADVVTLDRFMADRLVRKVQGCEKGFSHQRVRDKLTVMPPWPHEDHLDRVEHDDNPFRRTHDLAHRCVFMYSGNHSPAHPITTLLEAAIRFKDDARVAFLFIGAGLAKHDVERTILRHQPANMLSLPYQPLAELKYSLCAGDIHVVSMGDAMVGIVHPCKVYGAMAVGRPILLVGPRECHVADLLRDNHIGWHIAHGDVDGAVETLAAILAMSPAERCAMGERAREAIERDLSKRHLCGRFCDVLERGLRVA